MNLFINTYKQLAVNKQISLELRMIGIKVDSTAQKHFVKIISETWVRLLTVEKKLADLVMVIIFLERRPPVDIQKMQKMSSSIFVQKDDHYSQLLEQQKMKKLPSIRHV